MTLWLHRGVSYFYAGDYAEALADFKMAAYLKPNQALAYVYRGMVSAALNNTNAALSDYNASIRRAPQDAVLYRLRGELDARLGEASTAHRDYQRAAKLPPRQACKNRAPDCRAITRYGLAAHATESPSRRIQGHRPRASHAPSV